MSASGVDLRLDGDRAKHLLGTTTAASTTSNKPRWLLDAHRLSRVAAIFDAIQARAVHRWSVEEQAVFLQSIFIIIAILHPRSLSRTFFDDALRHSLQT